MEVAKYTWREVFVTTWYERLFIINSESVAIEWWLSDCTVS